VSGSFYVQTQVLDNENEGEEFMPISRLITLYLVLNYAHNTQKYMDNLLVVAASLRQTHSNLIDLIRVYLTIWF